MVGGDLDQDERWVVRSYTLASAHVAFDTDNQARVRFAKLSFLAMAFV